MLSLAEECQIFVPKPYGLLPGYFSTNRRIVVYFSFFTPLNLLQFGKCGGSLDFFSGSKAKYCPKKKRTFLPDKNFKFYGSAENGRYRISKKEGKELCSNANGLDVIFKVKNNKVVSISFVS